MRWPWILAGVVLLLVLVVAVAIWRWNKRTAATVERLLTAQRPARAMTYDETELKDLPAPVQRWFRRTLAPGQPIVRSAVVYHTGTFRSDGESNNWMPFTSTEHFTVHPPGFVWDARIRMMPILPVMVRDSYISGIGNMRGSVAGLVTVVNAAPVEELHKGAFQRYLAEAMWIPTALLPSQGVVWSPLDDHSAKATLQDGHRTISMDFHFNSEGDLVESRTMRYAEQDGHYVLLPWGGRCSDHQEMKGMRIPLEAEVSWYHPDGPQPYWRGRITDLQVVLGEQHADQ